jgi:integrase
MATPKKTATGRWSIQIAVAGQRDSGTFATKAQANAWAAQRSTELRALRGAKPGTTKTLRDALRRYAQEVSPQKKGERWEVIRLAAFESPDHAPLPVAKKLADLTTGDLALWRDARLDRVTRGTVLRDLTLLASVLEHARREWGWLDVNPAKDLRRPAQPEHRERVITGPEVRAMIRALGWPPRQADGKRRVRSVKQAAAVCFMLALQTGMRAGEICGLTPADVMADHLKIRAGKTGRRDVPMTPTTRRVVDMLDGWSGDTLLGIKAQTLDAFFRQARDKAGLAGFVFHDSRHTAATRLAQRLHVLDLCKVFGWKSTTRALTYFNPSASDLVKRMAG